MEEVTVWLSKYWWTVLLGVAVVMKILNKLTKHFSDHAGLVKWCLFIVDVLDIVKSTPPPMRPIRKDSIILKCLCFVMVAQLAACTTVAGKKEFDPRKAMTAACAITPAVTNIHLAVCELLASPKREECLKHQKIATAASNAVLGVAGAIYGVCNIR